MKQSTTSSTVRCSLLPPQLYFIRKATACLHSFIPICADSIAVGMVIVMCGRQAIDGDTAQVGPQIAEKLNLPQVTYVTAIDFQDGALTVRRELEDGYMTIKVQTPCVLTCIKELNTPRYMSVPGVMECYSKPYAVWDYEALKESKWVGPVENVGLKGSPTQVYKSFSPPVKGKGTMLEGADKAACEQLVSMLGEKHII